MKVNQAVLDHLTGIGEQMMEAEVQLYQKGAIPPVVVQCGLDFVPHTQLDRRAREPGMCFG